MKTSVAVISTFLIGAFISGGVTWSFMQSSNDQVTSATETCLKELNGIKPEVVMLRSNLDMMRSALEARITPIPEEVPTLAPEKLNKDVSKNRNDHASLSDDEHDSERVFIDWRVNSIGKIVTLNDDQRNRLRKRFEEESAINRRNLPIDEKAEELDNLTPLEEVIGSENARLYKQHVQAAFSRAESEELEKEIVWLGRRLSLTSDQENQVRGVFTTVEEAVKTRRAQNPPKSNSPQERMRHMIEESEFRNNLIRERLKPVLTESQMTEYAKEEADSAASDMAMFHSQ